MSQFPPQPPDPLQASVLICKYYFCEGCVLVLTFIHRREIKTRWKLEKRWREQHSSNNIHTIWKQMLHLWKVCNKNKKASSEGTPSVKYSLVFPMPPVLNIRYISAQLRYVTGMFPPPLYDALAVWMAGCRHGNTVMLPFVRRMKWPVARSASSMRARYGWAVAAPIVLATGRSGGGRKDVMAALCIREQWRLGPNPISLCSSGLLQAAQLGSVSGSPP